MPPTTPRPNRDRATYGDVGRIVLTFQQRKAKMVDPTDADYTAAHDAIRDEEPKRRYARVQDADGHRWERGNTRWSCLTAPGRAPWYFLVNQYGPITVLDENLPPEPAPRCTVDRQLINDAAGDTWAGGEWTTCNGCGSRVRFRVRGTDTPPAARILPHRTDGTPTR